MFQHFDWDLTHQVLFLYILPSPHMNLRDQLWKMLILCCRTDICSCNFFAKVSLLLDNLLLVPSLCKLNHISLCFIQISTKSPAIYLFPSGKRKALLAKPNPDANHFYFISDELTKIGEYMTSFSKMAQKKVNKHCHVLHLIHSHR